MSLRFYRGLSLRLLFTISSFSHLLCLFPERRRQRKIELYNAFIVQLKRYLGFLFQPRWHLYHHPQREHPKININNLQITHLSAHIVHVFNLKLLKDFHIPHCQIIFRANCTLNSLSKCIPPQRNCWRRWPQTRACIYIRVHISSSLRSDVRHFRLTSFTSVFPIRPLANTMENSQGGVASLLLHQQRQLSFPAGSVQLQLLGGGRGGVEQDKALLSLPSGVSWVEVQGESGVWLEF